MARKDSRDTKGKDREKDGKERKPFRRKVCKFCSDRLEKIDYRDTIRLAKFASERGKILPRRVSGTCSQHQRQLARAIKRARVIALMPFVAA
jgi:small subunit ribosomal protein S18